MKKTLIHITAPHIEQCRVTLDAIGKAQDRGQFNQYEFIITTENVKMHAVESDEQWKLLVAHIYAPRIKYCEMKCKKNTLQQLISTSTLFESCKKRPTYSTWEFECFECHNRNYFREKIKW